MKRYPLDWSDYHTHSRYCDGRGELEEYVTAALERGLSRLGFSAHAPVPFESEWHMDARAMDDYLGQARDLQERYRGRIELFVGFEVDYVPAVVSPTSAGVRALNPDFVIGSVHYLGRLRSGARWTVDGSQEELAEGVDQSFGGNARRAVEAYYRLVREMVDSHRPDVLGHLDLIKKHNRGIFDEQAAWYRASVAETLEAVAAAGCVVEINTGGVGRGGRSDFYPADWIVRRLRDLAIPTTISSDAHRPEHVAVHFERAAKLLRKGGSTVYRRLTESGWTDVELPVTEVCA